MPLQPGKSERVIGNNIREMREHGHPENVAIAAALNTARKTHVHKEGGGDLSGDYRLPELPSIAHIPQIPRLPAKHHHPKHLHVGPIHSPVAGRTDHLPTHVPSGSYVIPADIISGMGEGNTIAGFKHMKRIFGGIPYAGAGMPYGQNEGPYGMGMPKASGGSTNGVRVVLAGGEYCLHPNQVAWAGDGSMEMGHEVLDEFVKRYRQKLIETLKDLPGPRRD